MSARLVTRWGSVAVLVVAGFGIRPAGAQVAAPAGPHTDADIPSQRTANLTPAEQTHQATQIVDSISSIRRHVSEQLDHARQERDIIKVNCLNDKLTQIDVTLRSARDHQELLQNAISINNDGQRGHEFSLMTIFRTRSEGLESEARRCVGEGDTGVGNGTTVSFIPNPNVPDMDTTAYPVNVVAPSMPTSLTPVM